MCRVRFANALQVGHFKNVCRVQIYALLNHENMCAKLCGMLQQYAKL